MLASPPRLTTPPIGCFPPKSLRLPCWVPGPCAAFNVISTCILRDGPWLQVQSRGCYGCGAVTSFESACSAVRLLAVVLGAQLSPFPIPNYGSCLVSWRRRRDHVFGGPICSHVVFMLVCVQTCCARLPAALLVPTESVIRCCCGQGWLQSLEPVGQFPSHLHRCSGLSQGDAFWSCAFAVF